MLSMSAGWVKTAKSFLYMDRILAIESQIWQSSESRKPFLAGGLSWVIYWQSPEGLAWVRGAANEETIEGETGESRSRAGLFWVAG